MLDPLTAADLDRLDALAVAAELTFPLRWEEGILDAKGDAVFVNNGRGSGEPTPEEAAYLIDAANATPALVGLVRELVAALKPFAAAGERPDILFSVDDDYWKGRLVQRADFSRAAALLTRFGGTEGG